MGGSFITMVVMVAAAAFVRWWLASSIDDIKVNSDQFAIAND